MPSTQQLSDLNKSDLYDLAQKAGVEGRSDMAKAELVKALAHESDGFDSKHAAERTLTKRATWTGAITFGLISIPISLHTATEDRSISFHLLTPDKHARVRNQRVSSETGEPVEWEDLVRGYEYEKGHYVTFTEEELEQIPSESSRTIDVLQFTPAEQIDPLYFERPYYAAPDETGVKAYQVLSRALEESDRVGVGMVTIRNKEHPCALRVSDGVIVIETLRWPDEIRIPAFDQLDDAPQPTEAEVQMAEQLIGALAADFDPTRFTDSYRQRLQAAIAAKIEGKDIAVAPEAEERRSKVTDLMEALRASVEATEGRKSA